MFHLVRTSEGELGHWCTAREESQWVTRIFCVWLYVILLNWIELLWDPHRAHAYSSDGGSFGVWLRVWGVALLGVGKRLRILRRARESVLTTFRMADTVKEMLTMVGMLKFVTGRKAFLSNTESRAVVYIPFWVFLCVTCILKVKVKKVAPSHGYPMCISQRSKRLAYSSNTMMIHSHKTICRIFWRFCQIS